MRPWNDTAKKTATVLKHCISERNASENIAMQKIIL